MLSLEKGESFTSKGTAVKHCCVIHTCICFLDLMHSHPPPLKLRQRKESRWWGKKEGKPEFLWYKDEQIYNQGGNHMRWSYLSELISKCWITSRFKPQTPRDDSAFCPWTCFLIKKNRETPFPSCCLGPISTPSLELLLWAGSSLGAGKEQHQEAHPYEDKFQEKNYSKEPASSREDALHGTMSPGVTMNWNQSLLLI